MGNSILDFLMLAGVLIGGYLLITYKRPASTSSTVPEVSPTETPSSPELVPAAPNLDKKFKLSVCEAGSALDAAILEGKGECITAGSKHGVVVTLPDKRRCTVRCAHIRSLTSAQRKKIGVDKCKCDSINRADLESALSSYARAYKVYIQRSLN